jgi:hypothetical protein
MVQLRGRGGQKASPARSIDANDKNLRPAEELLVFDVHSWRAINARGACVIVVEQERQV